MPAFAAITLNDGQATPVSHSFDPNKIIGSTADYQDRSGGIPLGYPQVILTPIEAPKGSQLNKVRVQVIVPTLETATGSTSGGFAPVPTKAFECRFDGVFILPVRASLANRKDLLAFTKNLMAHSVITALVETQDKVY